jgi:cytochrome c biogenesis protein CcmG/thiol:disulfide interchange protein DsbE
MITETKAFAIRSAGLLNCSHRLWNAIIIIPLDSGLKRNLKTGIVLAFIVALLYLFARPDYRQGEASLRGHAARDFVVTLDGKPAHLSDFRGKVVLLNFWASWCPPCVDEAPALNQLQQRLSAHGGTILGVSIDEDQSAYEDFLRTYNVDFPTFRDPSRHISLGYGTVMIPETYVIDRHGRVDRKIVGPQDWTSPTMFAYLDSVLAGK